MRRRDIDKAEPASESRNGRRWGLRTILDVAASISVIVAGVAVAWPTLRALTFARPPVLTLPSAPISLSGAAVKGADAAKVAVIEWSDYECEFCERFARETMPQFEQVYVRAGKVLFAVKHFPLRRHRRAGRAAVAAECAGLEGKFWAMHDKLFEDPRRLAEEELLAHGRQIGLNQTSFMACLGKAAEIERKIQTHVAEAAGLGIRGTPTFLVGAINKTGHVNVTDRLMGAISFSDLENAVNKAASAVEGFR